MGQSFNPEDLFTYTEEEAVLYFSWLAFLFQVCLYPRQTRKVVTAVKYPTPDGFVSVTAEDMNNYWGEVSLEDVLDPERCKNLKAEDKSKRRALFAPLKKSFFGLYA